MSLTDPLFTLTGNRPDQHERAAVAAPGVGDRELDRQALAPQQSSLSDVERERAGVLFCGSHSPSRHSKIPLEPELNDPTAGGRQDSSERVGLAADIRRPEVRVVERVEQLGPELEVAALVDVDPFRDREVEASRAS